MTFVVQLKEETTRKIREQAAKQNTTPEELVAQMLDGMKWDESDARFDAAMNKVFDKYEKAFEVLAEGVK